MEPHHSGVIDLSHPYANGHCLLMQTCLRQKGETAQVQEVSWQVCGDHWKSLVLHCGQPKKFGLQMILDYKR